MAEVRMIARTELTDLGREWLPLHHSEHGLRPEPLPTDPDRLAEIAGRLCYRSEHRPNPATQRNADYVAHVIEQGHESVLAHASVSFLILDTSRSLTHELIRHRWFTFSEVSQRYVAFRVLGYLAALWRFLTRRPTLEVLPVYPPAAGRRERARLRRTMRRATRAYAADVRSYGRRGHTRKEARQAARAHLPNAFPTSLVVSANLRAWRDLLRQRLSTHADAEIRELADDLLLHLEHYAPATFADLVEEFDR